MGGPEKEPGTFMNPHGLALDSKENIYVAETTPGNRLQRFVKVEN